MAQDFFLGVLGELCFLVSGGTFIHMDIHTLPRRIRRVPSWDLADRLRKVRRTYSGGLSQAKFAESIGFPAPAYSAWESGHTQPRELDTLCEAIEWVYGVDAEWLRYGEEPPPPPRPRKRLPRLDSNQEPSVSAYYCPDDNFHAA